MGSRPSRVAGYRNFLSLSILRLRAVVLNLQCSLDISIGLLQLLTQAFRQASSFVFPDSARFRLEGLTFIWWRAAGLWDVMWSCGSGFWSIAKHRAEAELVESSAASSSLRL